MSGYNSYPGFFPSISGGGYKLLADVAENAIASYATNYISGVNQF